MISTRHDRNFVEVKKKFGDTLLKPEVVAEYNRYMSVALEIIFPYFGYLYMEFTPFIQFGK